MFIFCPIQETLKKMSERIEITSGNFDVPELPIQRRMEEELK